MIQSCSQSNTFCAEIVRINVHPDVHKNFQRRTLWELQQCCEMILSAFLHLVVADLCCSLLGNTEIHFIICVYVFHKIVLAYNGEEG